MQTFYDEYFHAGNTVEPHSFQEIEIRQFDNAKITCFIADYADGYFHLSVRYYDESNALVYAAGVAFFQSTNTQKPAAKRFGMQQAFDDCFLRFDCRSGFGCPDSFGSYSCDCAAKSSGRIYFLKIFS